MAPDVVRLTGSEHYLNRALFPGRAGDADAARLVPDGWDLPVDSRGAPAPGEPR
jgi:hypothetical protein